MSRGRNTRAAAVRLKDADYAEVKRLADKNGMTINDFLYKVIRQQILSKPFMEGNHTLTARTTVNPDREAG